MTDKIRCPKCGRVEGVFYHDRLSSPVKIVAGKYGTMCRRCQYNYYNAVWSRQKLIEKKRKQYKEWCEQQEAHGQLRLWDDL